MVCYIFPTVGAILVHAQRKAGKKTDEPGLWLNHLLWGGSIFGLVDHWWNGELFFIGKDISHDLLLGGLITLAIYAVWYAMVATSVAARASQAKPAQAQG